MTDYPNWFAHTAQANFKEFLLPLAGQPIKCIQLGAFTGDASVWMAENVLTHDSARLLDVDTWKGSDEEAHHEFDWADLKQTYIDKTRGLFKIQVYHGSTVSFLTSSMATTSDFIYIDADHTTVGVILDAELSWPLLKSGGIMAFDDYTWQHESGDPRLAPQVGIDLFLHRHQGDYELLAKNTQVWIRKR